MKKTSEPHKDNNQNRKGTENEKQTAEKNKASSNDKKPHVEFERNIRTGESIAKILTSIWNSQKSPSKVYLCSYRVHHGAIGFVGALVSAHLNKPTAYGFFKHLMDDDRQDWQEWFSGERLSKKISP